MLPKRHPDPAFALSISVRCGCIQVGHRNTECRTQGCQRLLLGEVDGGVQDLVEAAGCPGFLSHDDRAPRRAPDGIALLGVKQDVARHLHVPLQSGDDGVLRAMRRRYTTATYLRRLQPLAGDFNLTSDVIVGFPAEDDAAFEQTLRTVERSGLTKVHVFPYSPRPGTGTAAEDPVQPQVKKAAINNRTALRDKLSFMFIRQ